MPKTGVRWVVEPRQPPRIVFFHPAGVDGRGPERGRGQGGPNCSSSTIRMPSLTPVRMVGSPPDVHHCFVHVLLHFLGQILNARSSNQRTPLAGGCSPPRIIG